jgi:parvulin-like peptidyl-prolyl isomerase
VARRSSEDPRKSEGGQYDWTSQGSLAWKEVDRALFTLPVGELSPIIVDEESFHIVRVVERRDAGMIPFEEAQAEIEERILTAYRDGKVEEFLDSLRQTIPVWTIFDDRPEREGITASRGPGAAE